MEVSDRRTMRFWFAYFIFVAFAFKVSTSHIVMRWKMECGTTVNQNDSMFHDNDIVAGVYVERQTFIMMMALFSLFLMHENPSECYKIDETLFE